MTSDGWGSRTSLIFGRVQICSKDPCPAASMARRAAPWAGPSSDPLCLLSERLSTDARICPQSLLRDPPPIKETSPISAPASNRTSDSLQRHWPLFQEPSASPPKTHVRVSNLEKLLEHWGYCEAFAPLKDREENKGCPV